MSALTSSTFTQPAFRARLRRRVTQRTAATSPAPATASAKAGDAAAFRLDAATSRRAALTGEAHSWASASDC